MAEATQTVVNQLGYNPETAPYLREGMGQLRGLTYNYKQEPIFDASGKPVIGPDGRPATKNIIGANGMPEIESFRDPETYGYERQAAFSDLQKQAMQGARDMGPAYQNVDATGIMGAASRNALNSAYAPSTFSNQYQAPSSLDYTANEANARGAGLASLARGERAYAAQLGAAPMGQYQQFGGPRDVNAERVNAPDLRDLRMDAARDVTGRDVQSRDINAAQMGPAERVSTQSFAQPGSADAYMSPYMQSVVGIQQREAQRAADVASTGRRGEQTRAGAFGGSRAAIMDAEAARNLATQQGDIQAQGLQAAYQQAQQQFNTEQGQGLQAQTANQQAGLTVGQQNLSAQQQTNVQNEANRLQAQGLTSSQAMQAALANQGVQQQANVQNLSAGLQTQGLGAQTGLQAQQANQQTGLSAQQSNQGMDYNTAMQNAQMRQQMGLANQAQQGQYGLQQGQFNQAANMQTSAQRQAAAMFNPQAQNQMAQYNAGNQQQTELANQAARNRASEFGLGQRLTSAGTNAQYGQAANQLNEQSGQFGANYGLQGQQAAMQGATGLANIGNQGFGQTMQANQLLSGYGNMQQQQEQQRLSTQYQDFLNQQNDPYKKLGFMMNQASAAPTANVGSTMYQAPPSMLSQIGGFGATALGAYGSFNKANGGMVGRYAKGGLVRSRPQGLVALAIHSMT